MPYLGLIHGLNAFILFGLALVGSQGGEGRRRQRRSTCTQPCRKTA